MAYRRFAPKGHPRYRPGEKIGASGSGRPRRGPVFLMLGLALLYFLYMLNNSKRPKIAMDRFEMMGTFVEVTVCTPESGDPEALIDATRKRMQEVVQIFNYYDPESFVSRLNALPPGTPLQVRPEERQVIPVLEEARRVSEWTQGAFDITFASVGKYWRFDEQNPQLPSEKEIATALPDIDFRKVIVNRDDQTVLLRGDRTQINLGGIAKGAIVDAGVAFLREQEEAVTGALINAGGDMFVLGAKYRKDGRGSLTRTRQPWRVALQHPRNKKTLLPMQGFPVLSDMAIVTSGDYERMFQIDGKRYHHIIDPRTGLPTSGVASVTVFAPTASLADALATGLFVLGPEKGLQLVENLNAGQPGRWLEAYYVLPDLSPVWSKGIPESLQQANLKALPPAASEKEKNGHAL